jgi:hypothetical protein
MDSRFRGSDFFSGLLEHDSQENKNDKEEPKQRNGRVAIDTAIPIVEGRGWGAAALGASRGLQRQGTLWQSS